MRITTQFAYQTSIDNLQRRQQALTDSQERLTSGLRVQRASDDPSAAARAERARAAAARADSEQRALDASRNAMQMSEGVLGSAGELMQQVRERLLQAGNGSLTDGERNVLADAIHGLRNDLFALANRGDGSGRYLFGGQGSDQPPFVDAPGGVVYVGTGGGQNVAAGEDTPLAIDGQIAWLGTADPATPGATISPFSALDKIVAGLSTPGQTPAQVSQTLRTGLTEIDATAGTLSAWRSRAGEALNRIDAIAGRLADRKLDAERQRTEAEELDLVAAISDFQNRQTGYDAALKSYSIVQRLSLFDYIR
jgi:flagellar hook-associated protein 3 FlgL